MLSAISLAAQIKVSESVTKPVYVQPSDETALYSQFSTLSSSIASQEYPDLGDRRLYSADDFTVPSGFVWDIIRVESMNTSTLSGKTATFIVEIFADNSGLPAASPLYSQPDLGYTENVGTFSITLSSPIQLDPGIYWISIMADMPSVPYGQWGWGNFEGSQISNEFANRDPGNLLAGLWPPSWASGSTTFGTYGSYNLAFAIYGNASPNIPLGNRAVLLGISLIILFAGYRLRNVFA